MREGLAFMAAWVVSASCLEVDAHKAFNPSESEVNDILAPLPLLPACRRGRFINSDPNSVGQVMMR